MEMEKETRGRETREREALEIILIEYRG